MLLFIIVVLSKVLYSKYFKTSHVIVYQGVKTIDDVPDKHFKTSHVIVYRRHLGIWPVDSVISKHLMLLFISLLSMALTGMLLFQNISCYCLSYISGTDSASFVNFKTSHVIVYPVHSPNS